MAAVQSTERRIGVMLFKYIRVSTRAVNAFAKVDSDHIGETVQIRLISDLRSAWTFIYLDTTQLNLKISRA